MDELEKKPDAPQVSAKKKPEQKNSFDNRKKLMYVLCGGYLLYLALKMGRDYPGLAASGVWSSDRIIALCGTIAFSIIGAGRTETMRLICGADPMDSGIIRVNGKAENFTLAEFE